MRRLLVAALVVSTACLSARRPLPPPIVSPPPPVVEAPLPTSSDDPSAPVLVWPQPDGTWVEALRDLSRVNRDAVGDTVVIHQGRLIAKIGNWRLASGLWSSSVRTWRTLIALQAIHEGRIPRAALWADAGLPFPPGILLLHVLSRTSNAHPPGSSWRYSGGAHWPWQHAVLERLTGESREASMARLVSSVGAQLTWDRDPDDGTQRLDGAPYEMAKLGLLMLRDGRWRDQRILDADLWAMATGGGVNGDGAPLATEGWQIHLIRDGRHTELDDRPPMGTLQGYFAAGGVNRAYVIVLPALDVVVARVRRSGVFIDQFLPDLLTALDL